jgi:hypothetical protein
MTLDCHRHGGYVIWLGGSPGAGWCYMVTLASGSNDPAGSSPGENDVGKLFRTKPLALARARARIRRLIEASPPRSGGPASTPATTRRRTP